MVKNDGGRVTVRRAFVFLVVLMAMLTRQAAGADEVTGRNVGGVSFTDFGGQHLGQYVQQGGPDWVETGADGGTRFHFREKGRDDWSVYLRDDSRGVGIQLDLHTHKVMYRDSGPWRHLYNISDSWARHRHHRHAAQCYWMKSSPPYDWQAMPQHDFQSCYQLDSCDGGLGRSGGGCYKWADCPTCTRHPWHGGGSRPVPPPPPEGTGDIDPGYYYRLTTQFRGDGLCLDVFNGGPRDGMTHLARCADYSGQYWRVQRTGDGYYHLTTMFRGPNECLDVYNGGPRNNQPHLTGCANYSGQSWRLRKEGDWYRLTTMFRGDDTCLDIFNGGDRNNQPHLGTCASYSGQFWRLSRTERRVEH